MPLIPQHILQDIIARTNLLDIISSRVTLKQRGSQHWACCPFHQEKTASFSVNDEKQFFYCFGCGAKGNVIDFLMQYDRLDFLEAVHMLAEQQGIDLKQQQNQGPSIDRKPLYACMQAANEFFQKQLPPANMVISYLKKRGINGKTAKQYAIGFAPGGYDNLKTAIPEYKKHLLDVGLEKISNKNNKSYELFAQRIMFPIRDVRGRVIAFGGRVLSQEQQPKYLNSPETVLFHKGDEIYGLYETLQTKINLDYLVLVEGYMDVVMLAQCGEAKAVATLGTAINQTHFKKLFRYSDHIICCFDGDSAGRKASWKALVNVLPLMHTDRRVSFIHLPEQQDPDSFIAQHGLTAWHRAIKQAEPLSSYLFKEMQKKHRLKHLDDKAHFANQVNKLLENVPGGLFKNLLLQQLSNVTGISNQQLQDAAQQNAAAINPTATTTLNINQTKLDHIERCIGLLFQNPQLAESVSNTEILSELQLPYAQLLKDIIIFCQTKPQPTVGQLLALGQQLDQNHNDLLIEASLAYQSFSLSACQKEFSHAIQKVSEYADNCTINRLLGEAKHKKLTDTQKQQLQNLIRRKNQLQVAK